MKKLLIIIALAAFPLIGNATDYYVKNGGNDSYNGLNDALAWNTITKVNSEWAAGTFAPGDNIYFKRGDVWYGSINITEAGSSGSRITIGAYDTGDNPIIHGFKTLTSWTSAGGNIYYATLTCESAPEMVTIDNTQYAKGRWPNAGTWMTVTSRPSTTQIIDTSLPTTPDWDGAELVVRENRWILSRHTITDHTTVSITFNTPLMYNPTGYGYFIQNSLSTLDQFGEWFWDSSTNRLYVDFGGNSPGSYSVKASALDLGIDVNAYQDIQIRDITMQGFNVASVYANYGDYSAHRLKVDACVISFSGGDAVYVNRSSSDTISNNTIEYSNHAAVTLWGNSGTYCSINGNTIDHTGTVPGAAFNYYPGSVLANNAYDAVYLNPEYSDISDNTITYTGYIPVNFRGTDALVENNFISRYCYVKDDGAGVYVFANESTGKRILNNIILYGLGATEGMNVNSVISAHGIYTDGGARYAHFEGNIIGHIAKSGYHGNFPRNVTVTDNIFFDCQQFLNMWKYNTDGIFMTDLRITQNQFVSASINEDLPSVIFYQNSSGEYYTDIPTEIEHFGTIDSNYYYLNTECAVYFIMHTPDHEMAPQSLDRWVTDYGHDTHSTIETMTTYQLNSIGSNLLTNGTFDSNISGWTGTTGATPLWDSDELGDGGCIQMTSTRNNYDFYWWENVNTVVTAISGGAISNSNNYLLRFLAKSAIDDKTMGIKLYSTGTGDNTQRFFTVGSSNTQKDVLFTNPETVSSGATMRLALCDDPVATYMDNIGLYVADVTLTDWDQYLHFIYNETETAKTYYLSATMHDPTGASHSTSVTLNQWEGMILMGDGTLSETPPATPGTVLLVDSDGKPLKTPDGKHFLKH